MHICSGQKYLLFPIRNDAAKQAVRVTPSDGEDLCFMAKLGLPADWWAHLDITRWPGAKIGVSLDSDNSGLATAVRTSDTVWSPETIYHEPLRPGFHFTARRGWLNDPNGLVYHQGVYHLFFQHNPYGWDWGNMHWGHAVSTDLMHWKELPIALYPKGEADFAFSGSAVIDHDNTSGWGRPGRPAMVIAYTSTGRGECIAYSRDNGETWAEYEGNPVVVHKGRDPRLLWHAPSGQWVMALYDEKPGMDPLPGIAFYTSPDLKQWRAESWIEGFFECPDLFPLPIDGDESRVKWVLTAAPGDYCIGDFDGKRFEPESCRLPAPAGEVGLFYAPQTFTHHPEGKIVQTAWGRIDSPQSPFNQLMLFPSILSLKTTVDGVRLCREPVDSIRTLYADSHKVPPAPLGTAELLTELAGDAWDIEAVLRVGQRSAIQWTLGGDYYVYHAPTQTLAGPKGSLVIPCADGILRLRILIDRTVVEVFGDLGQAYGVFSRSNPGPAAPLSLSARRTPSDASILHLVVHWLRSAWDQ